jgi:hypothetical protein
VTAGAAAIDLHWLAAILALLPALVIALGLAICELIPNDRN